MPFNWSLLKIWRELAKSVNLVSGVTRVGDFKKFWVKNYVTQVAQMYSDFWAILKTSSFR